MQALVEEIYLSMMVTLVKSAGVDLYLSKDTFPWVGEVGEE